MEKTSKYNIGDKVWRFSNISSTVMICGPILIDSTIKAIYKTKTDYKYHFSENVLQGGSYKEDELFASKQEAYSFLDRPQNCYIKR